MDLRTVHPDPGLCRAADDDADLRRGGAATGRHGTARAPGAAGLAGHLQTVRSAPVTRASVSVSFDGGKTWHKARVSGRGGRYAAMFTAPPGAMVTLRTGAADVAGGTVMETITSAYRTGR